MAYSMKLSDGAVAQLVAIKDADEPVPHGTAEPTTVVYVLGLKPEGMGRHAPSGWKHKVAQFAAKYLQPGRPIYAHCEILMPLAGKPGLFSTYSNGGGAGWRHPSAQELGYYVIENAALWHAVPIRLALSEAKRMQEAANDAKGAPYSFRKYVMAGRGFRRLAWLFSRGGNASGHCANITARVVKGGTGDRLLHHVETFYGPSALMAELHAKLARGPLAGAAPAAAPMAEAKQIGLPFPEFNAVVIDAEVAEAVDSEDAGLPLRSGQPLLADNVLLYGSDAEVGSTSAALREAVLDNLADLVLDAATVSERTMYEQLLARALFRARLL